MIIQKEIILSSTQIPQMCSTILRHLVHCFCVIIIWMFPNHIHRAQAFKDLSSAIFAGMRVYDVSACLTAATGNKGLTLQSKGAQSWPC